MKPDRLLILLWPLACLPFVYMHSTIDPVTVPRLLLLAATLAISGAVLAMATVRNQSLNWSFLREPLPLLLLGYLLIEALSILQAANLPEAIFAVVRSATGLAFFVIVRWLLANSANAESLIVRCLSLIGLGLATVGLLQYYDLALTGIPGNIVPYGTMANKNLLSSAVLLTTPFSLLLVMTDRRIWRILGACSALAAGFLILVSHTRTAGLALTAGIAAGVFLLDMALRLRRRPGSLPLYRHRRWIHGAAVILIAVIAAGATLYGPSSWQRVRTQGFVNATSSSTLGVRLFLWERSLEMAKDNPLVGVGAGNWKVVLPSHGIEGRSYSQGSTHFQRPHNDFLWVLAETGLPGLIVYLAILVVGAWNCARALFRSTDRRTVLTALSIFGGLCAYFVVASFSYPRERVFHTLVLMLMLAVSIRPGLAQFGVRQYHRPMVLWLFAAIVVPGVSVGLVLGWHRLDAEQHTKRAVAALAAERWDTAIEETRAAASPLVNLDPSSTPIALYRGIAWSQLNRLDSAMAAYQEALKAHPYHLQVLNNLGSVYEANGDHAEAERLFKEALRVSPHLEQTLVNLAAVYYNTGDYAAALKWLTGRRVGPADPRYDMYLERIRSALKPLAP